MLFKKREKDIEMSEIKQQRTYEDTEETQYRPVNWKKLLFTPKYIPIHLLFIAVGIATAVLTLHHDEVVKKLRPFSEDVRDLPAGFLIPIFILIIISFPPLFGHEIIAFLCGIVYGLWVGFAIVAAGTFIGEIGTWFAFKHLFRNKAAKLERTNLNYGAMARMTRDGGFFIVVIIRLSAAPAHFSTAVFSTCDVKFWHFAIATLLSMPKQIFLVYLGVLMVEKEGEDDNTQTIIFGIIFLITVALGVWIFMKMKKIKVVLLEEQEKRRVDREEQRLVEDESSSSRRFGEEPAEWDMQPTQPARGLTSNIE
ncbi:hypothetical protein P153DRAFT_368163 [Dothidotthia symphoricarpi CBS 119687]|uniref:Golgi apparatus membrane protein TVP38 n=1 Tax=Dothidotthia symphoricarpi CBS 119687 TaxID=1392245 RepID=A0A6A6A9N2_9PLEO|nr:uncharacterized protein P153DRAFT_368163 [Dothidotthia symphoricarpi CBS 119687]KAF2127547.1 hypothetical protein P153DRAFT_368163 [Dothidotthia symphoricarpi CBS 119687]